jgi:hypothetical protein
MGSVRSPEHLNMSQGDKAAAWHILIRTGLEEALLSGDVCIYEGPLVLRSADGELTGEGAVRFSLSPEPQLRFSVRAAGTDVLPPSKWEHIEIPKWGSSARALVLGVGGSLDEPRGLTLSGIVQGALDRDCGKSIGHVRFHLVNFRDYHGEPIYRCTGDRLHGWAGRVSFQFAKWRVTLDSLEGGRERFQEAKAVGAYVITHAADLRRVDNKLFSVADAKKVLEFLYWFFSFVNGARCDYILPVGVRYSGPLWEEWGTHVVAPARYNHTWLAESASAECFKVAEGCYACWNRGARHDWFNLAISLYLESNHNSSGTDLALTTAQIALELLGWVILVEEHSVLSEDGFNGLKAADKLRTLLLWTGVPAAIPESLRELRDAYQAPVRADGPQAISDLRNALVHPAKTKRQRLHSLTHTVNYQAWQLSMWYVELVLLKLFGYDGGYDNRLGRERPMTVFDLVPWSPLAKVKPNAA